MMLNQRRSGYRATTIEELETILSNFADEANVKRGLAFKPRPTDIIISPYAKCGTTWLQHIAHGLRTRGSMDFDEITIVTPWIEIAYDLGWDLDGPQVAEPRVYKSHTTWHEVPKGGRYICAFRNSHDAFVSYYRFFEGFMFEPGTINLETLLHWRWPRDKVDSQGYWHHLSSWWEQRHNKDVLLLCYEDMKADLPGTVRKIARFMEIALDEELLDIVTRQSSREFMLAHKHHFDEHPTAQYLEKRANLPTPISAHKVTPGPLDEARYQLSPLHKAMLDDIWREQITPRFGLARYDDLRQSLRELHRANGDPDRQD
jgi:hypothetical protein